LLVVVEVGTELVAEVVLVVCAARLLELVAVVL
jgi:hypothetical protein